MNEKDGYLEFFDFFNIDLYKFYEFGLRHTELIRNNKLWDNLIKDIDAKNKKLYIRQYSRNGLNTNFYTDFYAELLQISINFDSSNNTQPTKIISKETKSTKKEYKRKDKIKEYTLIKNYQVAHIFAKTKNIYCFLAPWNIAYIPKVIDPFTGHEAKGISVKEYTNIFRGYICVEFRKDIKKFNEIMKSKSSEINEVINNIKIRLDTEIENKFGTDKIGNKKRIEQELNKFKNFKESINEEFSIIPISDYIDTYNDFKIKYKKKYKKDLELTKSLS